MNDFIKSFTYVFINFRLLLLPRWFMRRNSSQSTMFLHWKRLDGKELLDSWHYHHCLFHFTSFQVWRLFCSVYICFVYFKAEFQDVKKYVSFQLVPSLVMPIPAMFSKMSTMVYINWLIILNLQEHFLLQYFQ